MRASPEAFAELEPIRRGALRPVRDHEDIVLQLGPPFLQIAAYEWRPGY
jgi:hypothetical protein